MKRIIGKRLKTTHHIPRTFNVLHLYGRSNEAVYMPYIRKFRQFSGLIEKFCVSKFIVFALCDYKHNIRAN